MQRNAPNYDDRDTFDRAIEAGESIAREYAEEFFREHARDSGRVWEHLVEHAAVCDSIEYAVSCSDTALLGAKLWRAVNAARIEWANKHWRSFAAYRLTHDGWPQNDRDLDKGDDECKR